MDINFNNLQKIIYNGVDLDKVYYNNVLVFQKQGGETITMILGGNWKMNIPKEELKNHTADLTWNEDYINAYLANIATSLIQNKHKDTIILFPPALYCRFLKKQIDALSIIHNLKLGIQMISEHAQGAFTGQLSASMAADVGCEYALIGTGEERVYIREKIDTMNHKINQALHNNLTPILFVGEDLSSHDAGFTWDIINEMLTADLANLSYEDLKKIIFIYEPIWAIGTGRTATPDEAQYGCWCIRHWLETNYGTEISNNAQICYAGSVKPSNITEIIQQPDINGAIASGASLRSNDFAALINNATA